MARKDIRVRATKEILKLQGDAGSGGVTGLVPPPSAGDAAAGKFLKADGTWVTPPDTSYTSPVTTRGDLFIRDASADARLAIGVANTYLKSNGTDPSWVNGWTLVLKTADETLTANTTYQDDDHLTFAVAASTKYLFRGRIFYNTTATADFKSQFTGPAAPTLVRIEWACDTGVGLFGDQSKINTAFSTSVTNAHGETDGVIYIEGIVHNGANSGSVTLQWAQNTSNLTTTVYAGSYLEWIKVA